MDAVFLAAACPAMAGDRVLEAGCGVGAASLCLLARVPGVKITGVEIEAELAALAQENALANRAEEDFNAVIADVTSDWRHLSSLGLSPESYDHVIANPPFYAQWRGRPAKDPQNARARAMDRSSLHSWLRFLAAAARPGGTCTVIYTAAGLPELLEAIAGRFGGLQLIALHPKANAPAVRVIVRGTKGSRAPLAIEQGIILHEADGRATKEATAILRAGDGLI
jgi:tRNA1(Val) A37 N6-methylase TrmN6